MASWEQIARKAEQAYKELRKEIKSKKKSQRGVYNYFDCSTAHISAEENRLLLDYKFQKVKNYIVTDTEYGWWIHVPEKSMKSDRLPNLKNIMKRARELQCNYVLLDRDGEVHDDLKQFNW